MKILKAEHLGMCFGVRDAIALARAEAARQPVTILGQLVHNPTVLQRLRAEGVETLRPRAKFGVAAQTTQPIERVRHLCGLIRAKFPESEVKFVDTVCQPTKLRQNAATDLAGRVEVMIVIGGCQSNNTRELAE